MVDDSIQGRVWEADIEQVRELVEILV